MLLATILLEFQYNIYVKHALLGIRAAVLKFWKKMSKTVHNIVFGLISLFILRYFDLNTAILIIFVAVYGIVAYRTFFKAGRK